MSSDSLYPSSVVLCRHARTLELGWEHHLAAVPHHALRRACRCAECESRRRAGKPNAADEEVELVSILPVADAGLQFIFSDGHQRGIYPWAYLRELAREYSLREAT